MNEFDYSILYSSVIWIALFISGWIAYFVLNNKIEKLYDKLDEDKLEKTLRKFK